MTADRARRRAKALGDGTRATIHGLLTDADLPLTVTELAERLQIHRTAVGQHLQVLREAGLVERSLITPAGRGRPGYGYRAVDPDPYRSLALWLAEAVRSGRSARDTGRDVARETAVRDADPVGAVVDAAARIGFDPVVHERTRRGVTEIDVALQSCPFAELASSDPGTVCDLHLGMVEGLVEVAGGATVTGLHIGDPHRGGCRITLRRTA